jgi:hypothetical protein
MPLFNRQNLQGYGNMMVRGPVGITAKLPSGLRVAPVLAKPFQPDQLVSALPCQRCFDNTSLGASIRSGVLLRHLVVSHCLHPS